MLPPNIVSDQLKKEKDYHFQGLSKIPGSSKRLEIWTLELSRTMYPTPSSDAVVTLESEMGFLRLFDFIYQKKTVITLNELL